MEQGELNTFEEVQFDLALGLVRVDETSYGFLIPTDPLLELLGHAGQEASSDFGRRLGAEIGRRIAERLGDHCKTASVEAWLNQLAREVALLGLGSLGLERWGRAAVVTIQDSPLGSKGDDLLSSLLEGAVRRALGRNSSLVVLDRSQGTVRLLLANPVTANRVREWLRAGAPWRETLMRLHAAAAQ